MSARESIVWVMRLKKIIYWRTEEMIGQLERMEMALGMVEDEAARLECQRMREHAARLSDLLRVCCASGSAARLREHGRMRSGRLRALEEEMTIVGHLQRSS